MEKSLVVAVHDFCPKYCSELSEILSELDVKGIDKRSSLVIPDLIGGCAISEDDETIGLLLEEVKRSNEICLHGVTHEKWRNYREFKNISYKKARWRLQAGKSEMEKLEIEVECFVPPFWKISEEGYDAVKEEGFSFLVRNPEIRDIKNEACYCHTPVWFWPHNLVYDYGFRLFDKFLVYAKKDDDLIRVEIHPQDLWKAKPFDYALQLLDSLIKERNLVSYEDFINSKI